MIASRRSIAATLFAPLVAVTCATAFAGAPGDTPDPARSQGAVDAHGPQRAHQEEGGPPPGGPGPGGRHGHGPAEGPGGPPWTHFAGLQLTEAQQDKLFAIEHASSPQRREQEKAVRRAGEALRELGKRETFDEAKAAALSRELGQAIAAEALSRARLHAQMLAVLTPEQRARLEQRRGHGARGRD